MDILCIENVDGSTFLTVKMLIILYFPLWSFQKVLKMLKRKVDQMLLKWRNSPKRKSLIVSGAPKSGKTFAIRTFGQKYYDEMIEINFKETPSARDIFSGDLDPDTLVTALRFRFPDQKIIPEKTLIFLDEIQECPEAITSLKFWTDDHRYDVIASGSLLGIDYNRPSSYPVGYTDYLSVYGLDFEEFLWASGISEEMIHSLYQMFRKRSQIPVSVNTTMMNLFRQYIAIGGMPEVVQNYVDHHDYRSVDRIQRELLQGYLYDIAHYASAEEKVKAEKCYLSLSKQLLDKENHKFQYKEIEHGARAQKYYSSIEWLLKADIVQLCRLVSHVQYDLDDYARDDFFRAYTTDLSLLIAMKDFGLKQHITENTLSGTTKGGIYECAIADILYKKGYPLWFYKNEKKNREIDFLIQKDGKIIPIEAKSGHTRATSLNQFMKENTGIPVAYKLIDGNAGDQNDRIFTMPLYMVMFL